MEDYIIPLAALVVAAFTVVGPLFLAIHKQKMEFKYEFIKKRKHEVIERYLKSVGAIAFSGTTTDRTDSAEWVSEIYMYAPKELWKDIDEMNDLVARASNIHNSQEERDRCANAINAKYIEFCKKFSFISRDKS